MYFTESFLYEATFLNPVNLHRHYLRHVLQPGEKFNPDDPKFPYMSESEYADRAEKLSLTPAGDSEDRVSHVIGFEIGDNRKVKIQKRSSDYPQERFCEVVMYVEDQRRGGPEIISYMIGRPGKLHRLKQQFVRELDEEQLTIKEAFAKLNKLK